MSDDAEKTTLPSAESSISASDELINASGHIQEIDRTFGFWSILSLAIMVDNAWGAGAGALVLALYNGGGPGVLYGLIVATIFYCFIGAGLAELSSAIPSSANVYHWASVTPGPRYGRICSWFAGWWNFFAWLFGAASGCLVVANSIIAMYSLYHPAFVPQRWHVFVTYLAVLWLSTLVICFGQNYFARFCIFCGAGCLVLCLVTILVCAILPSYTGFGYASNAFVWTDWNNLTGWSSDGLVFLMGMINGAYAIGTPDGVCHCSEEIPRPRVNIPKSIAAQLAVGFVTTFVFYVAILYAVTDLDAVFRSDFTSLTLVAMYQQATRSPAGTFALLFLFTVNCFATIPGGLITTGRMLWTLGRDKATPFSDFIGKVSPRWRTPLYAQLMVSACSTALGCIYVGSAAAFQAFISAFTVFTTMSYVVPLLSHALTSRRYIQPGPFWIPGICGYLVPGIASAYILVSNVLYMFPYTYPVASPSAMNWTSVIFFGITLLIAMGYAWKRTRGYVGPRVKMDAHDDIMRGVIGRDKAVHAEVKMAGS